MVLGLSTSGTIAIALAILLLVIGIYWVFKRLGILGTSREDEQTTDEQLRMEELRDHQTIGFRQRFSKQPIFTKLIIFSLIGFVLLVAFGAYTIARTGSANEFQYTQQLNLIVFGVILFVGGVWFKGYHQASNIGTLEILLESGDETETVSVLYDPDKVTVDREKTPTGVETSYIVAAYKSKGPFGLFPQPMLVADDPEIATSDYRHPANRVFYRLPGKETFIDEEANYMAVRAMDVDDIDRPTNHIDYEIIASDVKSRREVDDMQSHIDELQQENNQLRVKNGWLSDQMTDYTEFFENMNYATMQSHERTLQMFGPYLGYHPEMLRAAQNGDGDGGMNLGQSMGGGANGAGASMPNGMDMSVFDGQGRSPQSDVPRTDDGNEPGAESDD